MRSINKTSSKVIRVPAPLVEQVTTLINNFNKEIGNCRIKEGFFRPNKRTVDNILKDLVSARERYINVQKFKRTLPDVSSKVRARNNTKYVILGYRKRSQKHPVVLMRVSDSSIFFVSVKFLTDCEVLLEGATE